MATGTLLSPGVSVSVTDESNYVSAGLGTVPLILIATASNKTSTAGGTAPYTTDDTADTVQLVTSQRELLNYYGLPVFPSDASGNRIYGSELAEYGLMAAHSMLGLTTSAYVLRTNIDLTQLQGSSDRPYGDPADQTVYQDTDTTDYGIFEWDAVVQQFIKVTPLRIIPSNAATALYTFGTRPLPNFGKIGDYAVVATDVKNPVYVKALDNNWYQVGTEEWKAAVPTVQGGNSISDSSLTAGDSFRINGVQITVPANPTVSGMVNLINNSAIVGVTVAVRNSKLCIYADSNAESGTTIDPVTSNVMADGKLFLQTINGNFFATAGIPVTPTTGTLYNSPLFVAQPHYKQPAWMVGETGTPAAAVAQLGVGSPSNISTIVLTAEGSGYTTAPNVTIGIPWNSGVSVNLNDDVIINGYHYSVISPGNLGGAAPDPTVSGPQVNGNVVLQFAGIAATASSVLTNGKVTQIVVTSQGTGYVTIPQIEIDLPTGNTSRPTGSVWLKSTPVNGGASFDVGVYSSSSMAFIKHSAPVYVKGDAEANFGLDKLLGGLSIPAGTLYVVANFGPEGTDQLNYRVMQRQVSGATNIVGTVLNATFHPNDTFEISVTLPGTPEYSQKYNVSMVTPAAGQTGAGMFVSQLMSANIPYINAEVNDIGQISITHENGGVIRMKEINNIVTGIPGSALSDAGLTTNVLNIMASDEVVGEVLGTNWAPANLLSQQNTQPDVASADGTLWYYESPRVIDIMINDGAKWRGYQNVRKDTRGFDLFYADPNGVIFSTTAPTVQTTGAPLVYGDIWCDTADMVNYPNLKRYQNVLGVDMWVQIDKTDSVTSNGMIFADARWDTSGTTDPAVGTFPAIQNLRISDYVDLDVPDATLYPRGILLFNTRRSSGNIKKYVASKFNNENYPNRPLPVQRGTWQSYSGIKADGTPFFYRQAQRNVIVSHLQTTVDNNVQIREDQRFFNLIICPGYPELSSNLVQLNNDRRNTAFIIADTPMRLSSNSTELVNYLENASNTAQDDESGLTIADPYLSYFYPPAALTNALDGSSGQVVVPISHAILRTFIRSDQASYPWFAPAGTARGLIDNVTTIGYVDGNLNKFNRVGTQQTLRDLLYTHNVNPVAIFPSVGILNYGNKTRQGVNKAMDRINVARLINYIRYQLEIIVKPLIFEPNDKITRLQAKSIVESLMNTLVVQRGLNDYLVVCDETNNTPSTIDRNELHIDVAIEPIRAVEFIYIPVRILNTGSIKGIGTTTNGVSNTTTSLKV